MGEGPYLVTVPDAPNTLEHHTHLLNSLAPHYRVLCFEFPGFGYSHPKPGFTFDLDSLARVLKQVFDALGVRSAVLAVACLSSYAALRFAALHPEYVSRLVLSQVASLPDAIVWSRHADVKGLMRTPFIGQWFAQKAQKLIYHHWYHSALADDMETEVRYRHYLAPAMESIQRGACFCLASAYQHLQHRSKLDLSAVHQPALLLWGPRDHTHRFSTPDAVALQMPNCRFVQFEQSAHFPNLEEVERYTDLVLEVDQPSKRPPTSAVPVDPWIP